MSLIGTTMLHGLRDVYGMDERLLWPTEELIISCILEGEAAGGWQVVTAPVYEVYVFNL